MIYAQWHVAPLSLSPLRTRAPTHSGPASLYGLPSYIRCFASSDIHCLASLTPCPPPLAHLPLCSLPSLPACVLMLLVHPLWTSHPQCFKRATIQLNLSSYKDFYSNQDILNQVRMASWWIHVGSQAREATVAN